MITETMNFITEIYVSRALQSRNPEQRKSSAAAPRTSTTASPIDASDTTRIRDRLSQFYKAAQTNANEEFPTLKDRVAKLESIVSASAQQSDKSYQALKNMHDQLRTALQEYRDLGKRTSATAHDIGLRVTRDRLELEMLTTMRVIELGEFMVQQYNKGLVELLGYGVSFANVSI